MRIFFSLLCFLFSLIVTAQEDSLQTSPLSVGAKLHYGTIYIHTKSVENVAGSRPYGVELDFSKQRTDEATWQRWRTYPRKGLALSYFNLDNKILGHSATASYFFEPHYRISDKLFYKLRASIGVIYASNPYDAIKNVNNRSYTTYLNPYMQLGFGFGYRISNTISLSAIGNFQHFSNGGYKEPNRGVNWVTSSLGLYYTPAGNNMPKYIADNNRDWMNRKIELDAGLMIVPKQGYSSYLNAQRTFLLGSFVQATKQVTRISGLTAGAEIYYNKIVETPQTEQNKNASPFLAGIHGGHAFLLGRFTLNQQVGFYLLNETSYFRHMYFRWGLNYNISRHLATGVSLKSHVDNADFVDLRLMYRF